MSYDAPSYKPPWDNSAFTTQEDDYVGFEPNNIGKVVSIRIRDSHRHHHWLRALWRDCRHRHNRARRYINFIIPALTSAYGNNSAPRGTLGEVLQGMTNYYNNQPSGLGASLYEWLGGNTMPQQLYKGSASSSQMVIYPYNYAQPSQQLMQSWQKQYGNYLNVMPLGMEGEEPILPPQEPVAPPAQPLPPQEPISPPQIPGMPPIQPPTLPTLPPNQPNPGYPGILPVPGIPPGEVPMRPGKVKGNWTWVWVLLFILLIVVILYVVSRGRRSSSPW